MLYRQANYLSELSSTFIALLERMPHKKMMHGLLEEFSQFCGGILRHFQGDEVTFLQGVLEFITCVPGMLIM